MTGPYSLIYLHGLMSDSQGAKASLLRAYFPHILIPDFTGSLEERMGSLHSILGSTAGWTIIGSSFGGLMGALFTCRQPDQVKKLVLLAPALVLPDFANARFKPVAVPTVIYHGINDKIVPLDQVRPLAEQTFLNLEFHSVEDDHGLYRTAQEGIDWEALIDPRENKSISA